MTFELTPQGVLSGDRRSLAKAITLVESGRASDRQRAQELINGVLHATGNSIRIGITGVPGVGKSTFIERFGLHLIEQGLRVAVLAVDPSSPVAGGSILGDKTRMEALSREEKAFIRPSPAGRALGGVALKTRESMLLCEASGFDVVLVETVGVGQSEHQVAAMVDFFLVLLLPGGGDELQGIKKGIIELADALVINKADGEGATIARHTQNHYRSALGLLQHSGSWEPQVTTCSALEGRGIDELWSMVEAFQVHTRQTGELVGKRTRQNLQWMRQLIDELLRQELSDNRQVQQALPELEEQVAAGELTPLAAALEVMQLSRT